MDRAIFLARWSSHNRHAGVQEVITRHLKKGGAPAKHFGEKFTKARIDGVERLLEATARFLINLFNGVLKRLERRPQIVILRVQVFFSLFCPRCFINSCGVYRPKPMDFGANTFDTDQILFRKEH